MFLLSLRFRFFFPTCKSLRLKLPPIYFASHTIGVLSEFSESLGELGSCLLKRTALNDDEDSGEYTSSSFHA